MAEVTVSKGLTEQRLIQALYRFKAEMNDILGNDSRVSIDVSDVPTDIVERIQRHNSETIVEYGRSCKIESIAGRINITDDSMPF